MAADVRREAAKTIAAGIVGQAFGREAGEKAEKELRPAEKQTVPGYEAGLQAARAKGLKHVLAYLREHGDGSPRPMNKNEVRELYKQQLAKLPDDELSRFHLSEKFDALDSVQQQLAIQAQTQLEQERGISSPIDPNGGWDSYHVIEDDEDEDFTAADEDEEAWS